MQGRFSNAILYKFPRMSSEDTEIWKRFLAQYGENFSSFDYDFKVGDGVLPDLPIPEKFLKDFQELTKKRIDAIGYNPSGVTIIEVKPRAGTSGLGQLLTYKNLFVKSYPSTNVVALLLVCEIATDEEIKLYQQYGITIIILPR